jgi:hypothetical protein
MNPNRQFFLDDELFAIALAIPALFAVARYNASEREKTALARLQKARSKCQSAISLRTEPATKFANPVRRH